MNGIILPDSIKDDADIVSSPPEAFNFLGNLSFVRTLPNVPETVEVK